MRQYYPSSQSGISTKHFLKKEQRSRNSKNVSLCTMLIYIIFVLIVIYLIHTYIQRT